MPSKLEAGIKAIPRGLPYGLSTTISTPELPARAGALPARLQDIARSYLGARHKSGIALLEAARWLSEARQEAVHGEWKVFLEATGTSDDAAERLLNINALAMQNPQFADFVRTHAIGASAAALLALPSTPPQIIEQALNAPEPMKVEAIRSAIKEAKQPTPVPAPTHTPFWQGLDAHHPTAHLWTRERPDLLRSACGMTIQNRLPSGSIEGGHCSSCVRATWPQNQAEPKVATCIRCGAERTHTRSLTSYQAGLIDAYPDRDVTLCSRCIPELLAAQRAAEQTASHTIEQLDATLPKELSAAGYYWHSADPLTIAHNDGWRGEAPTVDRALELARNRERTKDEPITVFPALSRAECKELMRETKQFMREGFGYQFPTIGQALRIAARMALEATD